MDSRHKFTVPAVGQVEIRVDFHDPEGQAVDGSAWFQCLPCGRELAVNPDRQLFECPECGYELTPVEVTDLCRRYVEALEKTFDPVTVGRKRKWWLWRFIGSFVGRRKARKTLPPSSATP